MGSRQFCFILMPFKPELNYFYLYVRKYLDEKHGLICERADHKILTIPLLEKIIKQIQSADVIIADTTGRNPNVFYELGIAHAYGKNVILITGDPVEKQPTDIRHLEFIQYNLDNHLEFLSKLDNAMRNVFEERYREFYKDAVNLLERFNSDSGIIYTKVSFEFFQDNMMKSERKSEIPEREDEARYAKFILPRIIEEISDADVMQRVLEWLGKKYPKRSDV